MNAEQLTSDVFTTSPLQECGEGASLFDADMRGLIDELPFLGDVIALGASNAVSPFTSVGAVAMTPGGHATMVPCTNTQAVPYDRNALWLPSQSTLGMHNSSASASFGTPLWASELLASSRSAPLAGQTPPDTFPPARCEPAAASGVVTAPLAPAASGAALPWPWSCSPAFGSLGLQSMQAPIAAPHSRAAQVGACGQRVQSLGLHANSNMVTMGAHVGMGAAGAKRNLLGESVEDTLITNKLLDELTAAPWPFQAPTQGPQERQGSHSGNNGLEASWPSMPMPTDRTPSAPPSAAYELPTVVPTPSASGEPLPGAAGVRTPVLEDSVRGQAARRPSSAEVMAPASIHGLDLLLAQLQPQPQPQPPRLTPRDRSGSVSSMAVHEQGQDLQQQGRFVMRLGSGVSAVADLPAAASPVSQLPAKPTAAGGARTRPDPADRLALPPLPPLPPLPAGVWPHTAAQDYCCDLGSLASDVGIVGADWGMRASASASPCRAMLSTLGDVGGMDVDVDVAPEGDFMGDSDDDDGVAVLLGTAGAQGTDGSPAGSARGWGAVGGSTGAANVKPDPDAADGGSASGAVGGAGKARAIGRATGPALMALLRQAFDLPTSDAARSLGISTTELKRRCRQLNIRRWPQRKLQSLRRIVEATEADEELPEEARQTIRERVSRNRAEIMENPDAQLLPSLLSLRQSQYKAAHDRRVRRQGCPRQGCPRRSCAAAAAAAAPAVTEAPAARIVDITLIIPKADILCFEPATLG